MVQEMVQVMKMTDMNIKLITRARDPRMVLEEEDRDLRAREGNAAPGMVPVRAGDRVLRMVTTETGSKLFFHPTESFSKQ